ncbi:MAG: DUF2459 domain-containing protein [Bacteroidales bacterium]|nr:DUF2459 domain-containing protein [Bacteroidales bacterium]
MFSIKIFILSLMFFYQNNLYSKDYNVIECKKIYVLKHRWHTGIIINRAEAIKFLPSLGADFNNSQYIEIGWGDKDFYMAEKGTLFLALRAVLWPTESVLHVAEINSHPLWLFKKQEIIEFELTDDNFAKLIHYFNSSFYIDNNLNNLKLGKGLYGNSQFYLSIEHYHLFKTCNVWVAKGFKKANVPIKPCYAFTSKNVMKQLNKKNK